VNPQKRTGKRQKDHKRKEERSSVANCCRRGPEWEQGGRKLIAHPFVRRKKTMGLLNVGGSEGTIRGEEDVCISLPSV